MLFRLVWVVTLVFKSPDVVVAIRLPPTNIQSTLGATLLSATPLNKKSSSIHYFSMIEADCGE
jgi:hypothetical protein